MGQACSVLHYVCSYDIVQEHSVNMAKLNCKKSENFSLIVRLEETAVSVIPFVERWWKSTRQR